MTTAEIFNFLIILFVAVLWILIIIRMIKNKIAPIKTVNAMVVDKYRQALVSKTQSVPKAETYIIVFSAEGKKLSFKVSSFSAQFYKIKDKGTLKYKGNKIIEFK